MIDLKRLQELKDFILDEDNERTEKQIEKCNTCNYLTHNHNDCDVKDFCKKYTPFGGNEKSQLLLRELFETIEFLVKYYYPKDIV